MFAFVSGESYAELHHGNGAAEYHLTATTAHSILLILLNAIWFCVQTHGR